MYSIVLRFVEKTICGPLIQNFRNIQFAKEFSVMRKFVECCRRRLQSRSIKTTKTAFNKNSFLEWFLMGPRKWGGDEKLIMGTTEKTCVKIKEPYKLHQFREGPENKAQITNEEARLYYSQLQTIRHIDKASKQLYKEKIIRGFCHLYTGQEACSVGMRAAIRNNDNVITSHRCYDWSYLMGVTPFAILAELAGRQGGCARGKGGSMHMYAPRFYGGNGILGAQVPIGAGIALASKFKRDGGACLVAYGEGSANKGQIFESYHMANLWKLPCVFVCENNSRDPDGFNFYRRCGDIPGIRADGTDVLAVREATKFSINYAIESGPVLIELSTPSLPQIRAPFKTPAQQKQRDPISLFRSICLENNLLTMSEMRAIDRFVRLQVEVAVRKAQEDKEAPFSELAADVYADYPEPRLRSALNVNLPHTHLLKPIQRQTNSPKDLKNENKTESKGWKLN